MRYDHQIQLLVVQTFEVGTLHVVDDAPWALLLLLVEWKEIALCSSVPLPTTGQQSLPSGLTA